MKDDDKTAWPRGPWYREPDEAKWRDGDTGLPCLALRSPLGAWCGYVGIGDKHPYFGKSYDEIGYIEVHGGVTWAGPRLDDNLHWYIGFDCAHPGDGDFVPGFVPGLEAMKKYMHIKHWRSLNGIDYRDLSYVKEECKSLAIQLYVVEIGEEAKRRSKRQAQGKKNSQA